MAGGTHIFDMMKRLQNNEARKKKGYFKKDVYTTKGEGNTDVVNASPQELKQIRESAIAERKSELRKSIRVLVLSAVVAMVMVLLFLFVFNWS